MLDNREAARDRSDQQPRRQQKKANLSKSAAKGTEMDVVDVNVECSQSPNLRVGLPQTIKSPSDTTIYSPGLRKANDASLIEKKSNFVDSL